VNNDPRVFATNLRGFELILQSSTAFHHGSPAQIVST